MKDFSSYPIYISTFGNRWVLHRRQYGGVIETTNSRREALKRGEEIAKKFAWMFGHVPILVENKDGSHEKHKTVINRAAREKNREALSQSRTHNSSPKPAETGSP